LEPDRCFTSEMSSEVCGYDQDSYFHGKFLALPYHRRRRRRQIMRFYVFALLTMKKLFLVCCGEVGGCSLPGWRSQRGSKMIILNEKFIYCTSVLNY